MGASAPHGDQNRSWGRDARLLQEAMMGTRFSIGVVMSVAALAGVSSYAAGDVSVSFVNAPRFADAGATPADEERNLQTLAQHLRLLGQRYLPDGQTLNIEVLDVDLAGQVRPSRPSAADVRIMKGAADWPKLHLRYTLQAHGVTLRSGDETIADMDYLHRLSGFGGSDPWRPEKRMLDDWFKARFASGATNP
jgi:hypothetical protein